MLTMKGITILEKVKGLGQIDRVVGTYLPKDICITLTWQTKWCFINQIYIINYLQQGKSNWIINMK